MTKVAAGSRINHMNLISEGGLVVLGDDVELHAGALSCIGTSTLLIRDRTTATNWAQLDCRNGGIIVTGADGMWAHGVNFMTDDTHAIRDAATGERLNVFGGRIVVDRHVWLCEHVRVMGGARIGADSIVGLGALVKTRDLPAGSVRRRSGTRGPIRRNLEP